MCARVEELSSKSSALSKQFVFNNIRESGVCPNSSSLCGHFFISLCGAWPGLTISHVIVRRSEHNYTWQFLPARVLRLVMFLPQQNCMDSSTTSSSLGLHVVKQQWSLVAFGLQHTPSTYSAVTSWAMQIRDQGCPARIGTHVYGVVLLLE